jgi:hypothetical protein
VFSEGLAWLLTATTHPSDVPHVACFFKSIGAILKDDKESRAVPR